MKHWKIHTLNKIFHGLFYLLPGSFAPAIINYHKTFIHLHFAELLYDYKCCLKKNWLHFTICTINRIRNKKIQEAVEKSFRPTLP